MSAVSLERTVAQGRPVRAQSHLIVFWWATYCLLIMAASLYPFTDWMPPSQPVLKFLAEPWPRYLTATEVVLNVTGYVPFGLLTCLLLCRRFGPAATLFWAVLVGAALSLSMECLQSLLPRRIQSNLDVGLNALGAGGGAAIGLWLERALSLGARMQRVRDRLATPGHYGDLGATLIALWVFAQLNPRIGILQTGSVAEWYVHDAPLIFHAVVYLAGELALTALSLFTLYGLLKLLSGNGRLSPTLVIGLVLCAALLKGLGGLLMLRSATPWQWVTPGAMVGLLVGIGLLPLWERWRTSVVLWGAVGALIGVQIIAWWMPPNPYAVDMLHPVSHGHLAHLSGITWWTAQLWPWATLLCALGLSARTKLGAQVDGAGR